MEVPGDLRTGTMTRTYITREKSRCRALNCNGLLHRLCPVPPRHEDQREQAIRLFPGFPTWQGAQKQQVCLDEDILGLSILSMQGWQILAGERAECLSWTSIKKQGLIGMNPRELDSWCARLVVEVPWIIMR